MSQEIEAKTGRRFAQTLDWNLLRTFHNIVQAGGLTEAARRTNKGQPAVSMSLRRLEEYTNTSLCKRGPGGFELTETGQIVAEIAEQLFGSVSKIPFALNQVEDEIRGRVRLQMITNLVNRSIDRPLAKFKMHYPNVELFISIATWDVIPRNVMRGEVEIGIAPASQFLPGLNYEQLFSEVYRPFCGRSHPLFGQTVSSPRELAGYEFILTGADEPLELMKFRKKWGLGAQVAGLSEHLEEARRLAELGFGLCFLPTEFARLSEKEGRLHRVLDDADAPVSDIYLITILNAPEHPANKKLLEFFRQPAAD